MKEGIYYYRGNIYYGYYDEEQVSGGGNLTIIERERIKTNHPINTFSAKMTLLISYSLISFYSDRIPMPT